MNWGLQLVSKARTDILEQAKAIKRKQDDILNEAVSTAQLSGNVPSATVGILSDGISAWEPDKLYEKQYTLFTYDGMVGFTRQQNITSQSVYPPFTIGTESLYGVRPIPDKNGVYPYVYNMAASVGMKVRDGDMVYECYQAIDPMLYPPASIPAHFREWKEV